jgi:predicted nucleotidyltransferase
MRDVIFQSLNERQKELNCLYGVLEALHDEKANLSYIFRTILRLIPKAWQYPSVCVVRIAYKDEVYLSEDFIETEWSQSANIVVDNNIIGSIEVFYTQFIRELHNSQFLPQEQKLLNTIAANVSSFIFYRNLGNTMDYLKLQADSQRKENNGHELLSLSQDEHWKWRMYFAKKMAAVLDKEKYGVKHVYLIGSTKQATAGPVSDIDFIVHVKNKEKYSVLVKTWFEGWGLCLDEMNYQRTGHLTDESLVDVHIIDDRDIELKDSFASMINSIDSPAMKLM